jgi:hypothetical protein
MGSDPIGTFDPIVTFPSLALDFDGTSRCGNRRGTVLCRKTSISLVGTSFMNGKSSHPAPAPGVFPPNLPAPPPSWPKRGEENRRESKDTKEVERDPVSELLDLVSSNSFNSSAVQGRYLSRLQVINIIKVYLLAYRALQKRNLPTRNAIFLPSHTGTETCFGTLGPNVAIRNWFSVQVAKPAEKTELELAFRRRGATISTGDRGNRTSPDAEITSTGVKNPAFLDKNENDALGKMVELQLDLVYGVPSPSSEGVAPFKSVGQAIARNNITPLELGSKIGESGYAGKNTKEAKEYAGKFVGCHAQVSGVLRRFFTAISDNVSDRAKTWARDALATMAR